MKKNMVIILIFSLSTCFAQKEGDKIILGGTGPNPPIPFKNNILYINENNGLDSVDGSQYLNMPLYDLNQSSSTFWKDSISYTSNGYQVVNQRGEIIVPKLYTESFIDSGQYMSLFQQNSLFLNIKHQNQERVFLFYGQYKWFNNPNIAPYEIIYDTLFSYAELNSYLATGTSAVISKNNVLLSEMDSTTRGSIVACRHANGRDWWIIKTGMYHNKFYRGLLNPYGLEMKAFETESSSERHLNSNRCHFSNDGKRFVMYSPWPTAKVYLYDFDRCNGEISNPVVHNIQSFLLGTINYSCLSPDGSKMYFYRYPYLPDAGDIAIIQYDFETQQTYTLIEGNGLVPFTSPNGQQVYFFSVLFDSTQTISPRYLSIINNPNEFGANCELNLYTQQIPNIVGFVPPNHAYFRLGAAQGTVCDSLGLSAEIVEDWPEISVFPNPSYGVVQLRLAQWPGGSYTLLNSLGQQVAQATLPATGKEQILTLAFQHLPAGLYFLTLRNPQGQVLGSKRLMISRE